MANTKTLQDIRNIAYWIIKQPQNSSAYPLALFDSFANKAQNDICYGNVTNLQTQEQLAKVTLPFLNSTQFYSSSLKSTLTALSVVWATTLPCNTEWLATSWFIYLKGDIISYSGVNANWLTWVPATWTGSISFAFEAGTPIVQLYALPADFGQPVSVNYNSNQKLKNIDQRDLVSEVPTSPFLQRYFRNDFTSDTQFSEYYYTVINAQYLLFIIPSAEGKMLRFEYQKAPEQMVDAADLATIPDDYILNTVPYLAIAEMMANRWEMNEALMLNNFAFVNTKNMYKFYQTQKWELQYNQRVRTSKDYLYPNI